MNLVSAILVQVCFSSILATSVVFDCNGYLRSDNSSTIGSTGLVCDWDSVNGSDFRIKLQTVLSSYFEENRIRINSNGKVVDNRLDAAKLLDQIKNSIQPVVLAYPSVWDLSVFDFASLAVGFDQFGLFRSVLLNFGKFKLSHRGRKLEGCDPVLNKLVESQQLSLFDNQIYLLELGEYLELDTNMCPLVFHNAAIELLGIRKMVKSLIAVSHLGFSDFRFTSNQSMAFKCHIQHVYTGGYNLDIDASFFSPQLFSQTQSIKIEQHLRSFLRSVVVMFKYLYYSCYFNLLGSMLAASDFLTDCVRYNGIYCSPFILSDSARAYYLFGVNYLGQATKTASNLCFLCFAAYRYSFNLNKWQRLRSTRPKRMLFIFIIVSLLAMSRIPYNERFSLLTLISLNHFLYFMSAEGAVSVVWTSLMPTLSAISIADRLLQDVVMVLICVILDLLLLRFVKAANNQASSVKKTKKLGAERKLTAMVVLNLISVSIFRTPGLIVTLVIALSQFEIGSQNFKILCGHQIAHVDDICSPLYQISQFFFSLTYFENFFVFYFFNDSFKVAFKSIFRFLPACRSLF
nr:G protein-coupled receptor [Proales similis]